ncbi:MAG: hypothetical protein KF687_08850 [Cyclobacteriaceae bacterium]|nr:hypothetical protein [Cyclobacteriaceae bacterium]
MRVIRGLILFCFLAVGVSSCFEPPEFAIAPQIAFNKIEFKVTPDPSDADSLIIYIDFRDGNGDMGLSNDFRNDPYHERNFHYEDVPNGRIKAVGTVRQAINKPPLPNIMDMIVTPPTGKLVTNRTRNKPGFGTLPPFNVANLECRDYTTQYLLVAPSASSSIDASYNIVDTLYDQGRSEYYVIQDTLYFERNTNHHNITIRFWQSTGGPFTEFSWEDTFCQTFSGRFPVLTDKTGPLEGTIRYAMASTGFTPLFSIRTLMLDVIVRDRALNQDSIRTPEFTLAGIRIE